jgi:large repetitive protein
MARRIPARGTIVRGVAVVGVLAVIGGFAAFAPGFDSKQTVPDTGTVWAYEGGATPRYGSVTTALGELDSVKQVEHPSTLIQTSSRVLMYSRADTQVEPVNVASPVDLVGKTVGSKSIDAAQIASSGDYVAYRTSSGVSAGTLDQAGSGHLPALTLTSGSHSAYTSAAIAVDSTGIVYSYSAKLGSVARYSIPEHRLLGSDSVTLGPKSGVSITAIDQSWVLLSGSRLWFSGKAPVKISVSGKSKLEQPATGLTGRAAQAVYVSDSAGLKSYQLDGASSSPIADVSASGTAASPTSLDGTVYAAWLTPTGPGKLWNSNTGKLVSLSYGSHQLSGSTAITPTFQTNGREMILNETTRGWVWTVPDGKLVPSSQAWEAKGSSTNQEDQTTAQVQKVVDPKPPTAVADQFGVRAGQLVTLPVLLNDHDPNEDVLSIVPSSLRGPSASFATLKVTNDEQEIVAQLSPTASGTATFTYQVTDGTSANGGLKSTPATVTLSVRSDSVNTAPKWCGVQGCLTKWPTPQAAPGSKVTVDALDGWVDPEGDPFFISSVTIQDGGVGSVASTPQGQVVYQDPNPNGTAAVVHVDVQVSDTDGLTTDKAMTVTITPTPALVAKSFVAVGEAGQPLTVDLSSHVVGAVHGLTVVSAKPLTSAGTATVNGTSPSFVFEASAAGSYLIDYTVADGDRRETGLARVILEAASGAQLTTAPVTAFVELNQDTTVDVLSAVSNPQNLVLLVSGVSASPAPGSDLEVNDVAQNQLRISGISASGRPGKVGVVNYTVSDGTGNRNATAQGQATVYLVPTPSPARPITVDDSVTVRAGAEIDVPVLDNDVSASGSTLDLDPTNVQVPAKSGMAFASGSVVRYLAPTKPGKYDVVYHAYSAGYPQLSDAATIHFTVVGNGSNAPPTPPALAARVTSGQSVSIPFTSFGVDPDGDAVTLATVTAQPHNGSASISSDGTSLVYTSFVGSPGGSDQFTYKVRDSKGKTGTASVEIGVLAAADADPSPVTYSDYVTIKRGGQAVVYPLANDIDPAGGTLALGAKSVLPDLPQTPTTVAAYTRQLTTMNPRITGNTVKFSAGDEVGTKSFLYTVRDSSTGATAEGRIIITVTSTDVPQWPIVTDTTATALTRAKLSQGIDVVSGKVSWTSGDASKLALSLVGNPTGFSVVGGSEIKGDVSDQQAATIPFELAGKDFSGNEVRTFGFLHIPALADTSLSLTSIPKLTTPEDTPITFDIAKYIGTPTGSTLEVDKSTSSLPTSGSRHGAQCKLVGASSIEYSTGVGTIYDDSCTVAVKLSSQTYYSYLVFPIHIKAKHPQPVLGVTSLVSSPGKSSGAVDYDLQNITTWDGDISTLKYSVSSYAGTQFTVAMASDGHTLTVKANDTAIPGSQEIVLVTAAGPAVTSPAPIGKILLRVGPEPSQLPVGAHVTEPCSQNQSSCVWKLVGGPGEVNPFATALTVVSVTNPASCPQLTFSPSGSQSVSVSWADSAPGGSCTASFVVQDAANRQGTGTVTIDFKAYPSVADSLTQIGSPSSVTLQVNPGASAAAYPALSGFHIYGSPSGGPVLTTCTSSGACKPITDLRPGVKTTFYAKSYNSVGDSVNSISDVAWAYSPPGAPTISNAHSVYSPASTTSKGELAFTVTPSPGGPPIGSYQLSCDGAPATVGGNGTSAASAQAQFPVSCNSLEATAVAAVQPYDGSSGNGPQSDSASVTVAGVPSIGSISGSSPTSGQIDIAAGNENTNNGNALNIVYAVFSGNSFGAGDCSTSDGTAVSIGGSGLEQEGPSSTFTGLDITIAHTVVACGTNGYGIAVASARDVAAQPVPAYSSTEVYTLSDGSVSGVYQVQLPAEDAPTGFHTVFSPTSFPFGAVPSITGKYCLASDSAVCGAQGSVAAADSAKQEPVRVTSPSLTCRSVLLSNSAQASAAITGPGSASVTDLQYMEDPSDGWNDASSPDSIPGSATKIQGKVVVTWTGVDSALTPYTTSAELGDDCR